MQTSIATVDQWFSRSRFGVTDVEILQHATAAPLVMTT
jgi:hypothetical protein